MRILLLAFFGLGCTLACGQDQFKNYLGFNFFDLETNAETLQHNLEPKFVTGIVYERKLAQKWSLVNRVDYGENVIRDLCNDCPDAVYGIGQLIELDVLIGTKYTIQSKRFSPITYFIEPDLYYSFIQYTGDFEGGWSGGTHFYSKARNIVGGAIRLGLNYFPMPRILLTLSSSLRLGRAWEYNKYVDLNQQSSSNSATALELRFGFLF